MVWHHNSNIIIVMLLQNDPFADVQQPRQYNHEMTRRLDHPSYRRLMRLSPGKRSRRPDYEGCPTEAPNGPQGERGGTSCSFVDLFSSIHYYLVSVIKYVIKYAHLLVLLRF